MNTTIQENVTENTTESCVSYINNSNAHLLTLLVAQCTGMVTNLLSAKIWFKDVKTRSGAFFLGFLSLFDGFFCLLRIITKVSYLVDVMDCYHTVVNLVSHSVAAVSRLLTFVIVVQRWLAISRPLSMTHLCTFNRQVSVLSAIFLVMLGLLVFVGFHSRLHYNYCQAMICRHRNDIMKMDKVYQLVFGICHAIVVLLLFIFSSLLLYSTCKMTQSKSISMKSDRHRRLELHMSIIVLCVSAFSLLEFLFTAVFTAYVLKGTDLGMDYHILYVVFQWAYTLNSSIYIVFYVIFAREFRGHVTSACKNVLSLVRPCRQGKELTQNYVKGPNSAELNAIDKDSKTDRTDMD